jgi:hypothetical protein
MNDKSNCINLIEIKANNAKQEAEMVWYLIENIEFFQKNNYRLALPKNELIEILIEKSKNNDLRETDFEELSHLISEKIYNENDYETGIRNIKSTLPEVYRIFPKFEEFHLNWDFKIFQNYKIFVTLYGPGGSYESSNGEVTILSTEDGNFKRGSNPLETIVHELVHIGIEECLIQKFGITQIIKERIVDKFVWANFKNILPDYYIQDFGDNSIDRYLEDKNCWNNLPQIIEKYVNDIKIIK